MDEYFDTGGFQRKFIVVAIFEFFNNIGNICNVA